MTHKTILSSFLLAATEIFLFLFLSMNGHAQNYLITFEAIGSATSLDSVKTENLTQGHSQTIGGNDILRLIVSSNGIDDIQVPVDLVKVCPNPMQSNAEISFYSPIIGLAKICIYNVSGQQVLCTEDLLSTGLQNYIITGLQEGMYFIRIFGDGYAYSSKLLSTSRIACATQIKYLGNEKRLTKAAPLKSTKATIDMAYASGDNLRFTGYSNNCYGTMIDVPTCSKTINIDFSISLPTITSASATNILNYTAISGGTVVSDGGCIVTARGICYSLYPNPTAANSIIACGAGVGAFIANLSGLTPLTTYYVRAYATNSTGIAYGNEISFSTVDSASLSTTQATSIGGSTAISGGTIYSDGGSFVTMRGVCWDIYPNPMYGVHMTQDGNGTGNFSSSITGLNLGTTYHVRAYAINSVGIAYGDDMMFTTLGSPPIVSSSQPSAVTAVSARINGLVNANVASTDVSVEYGLTNSYGLSINASPSPLTGNINTVVRADISGLSTLTTYHYRIKAENSFGTAYSNDMTFTTNELVTDIDGNIYNTVTIGSQIWMTENLKVTHYRNGNDIPLVTDPSAWQIDTSGAYCDYMNTPLNSLTYGKIYNWYAVNDTSNIAPLGWHAATDLEWATLTSFLGGSSLAGGKLKEAGTAHWQNPNTGATNETGFSALPGGFRDSDGTYELLETATGWWCFSSGGPNNAVYYYTGVNNNSLFNADITGSENAGISVRCVKD